MTERRWRGLILVGALLVTAFFNPSAVFAATDPPPREYTYDGGFAANGEAKVPPRVPVFGLARDLWLAAEAQNSAADLAAAGIVRSQPREGRRPG